MNRQYICFILVCSACHSKVSQTGVGVGCLNSRNGNGNHSSGGWKSKIWVSSESFLWLLDGHFLTGSSHGLSSVFLCVS